MIMNETAKNIINTLARFFGVKRNRYLVLLVLIGTIAFLEYYVLGLVRRTFVFYSALEGTTMVEDRMFRRSVSKELDIRRYVEEALLGPVSQEAAPLFPLGTRLLSLLFRDGVVYADFSGFQDIQETFLAENGVFNSFLTLNEGIRRNFSIVKDVKFFIDGNEIFFREFHVIFTLSADNTIKPVKRR